jgi:hypothetical protein
LKAIDKYAKDISDKLDSMFPNAVASLTDGINGSDGNKKYSSYNEMLKDAEDDDYYLERNLDPPRFAVNIKNSIAAVPLGETRN